MRLVILGPQGSGKGTQAKLLSDKLHIPHITTGEIFRKKIASKTQEAQEIASLINKGKLVPDEIVNQVVYEALEKEGAFGFILDGYPRNINQAKFLDGVIEIDHVIEIWISDSESIRRLTQRRSCSLCGVIYSLNSKPPKVDGVCNDCGGRLIIREDDYPEAIEKRLEIYHRETEAVVEYYKNKGLLHKVDGMGTIEEVFKRIEKALSL